MSRLVLVDSGALQMLKNAVLRISEEQGRPILKEMIEELDKTYINIEEIKVVAGSLTKRGWVEEGLNEQHAILSEQSTTTSNG